MVARLQDLVASGAVADLHALSYAIAVLLGLLVAASTVPFALIRVYISDRTIKATERTTEATEQGLITDRITATVTGLGAEKTVGTNPVKTAAKDAPATEYTKPNLEVRLGAAYALERIAQDSERDHIQIIKILCTYIRNNAPWTPAQLAETAKAPEKYIALKRPRADIQAALTVISRGAQVIDGNFARARLWQSQCAGAVFIGTNFNRARLRDVDFTLGSFTRCQFDAATDLTNTVFDRTAVQTVDFSTSAITSKRLKQMFGDGSDTLPANITRPPH